MLDVGRLAVGDLPTAIEPRGPVLGFATLLADYRYLYINQWLADWNGFSPATHYLQTIWQMLPNAADQVKELLDEARDTRTPVSDIPIVWQDAQGVEHEGFLTYRADFLDDGTHVAWTAIVRSIHEIEPTSTGHLHAVLELQEHIRDLRRRADGKATGFHRPLPPGRERDGGHS